MRKLKKSTAKKSTAKKSTAKKSTANLNRNVTHEALMAYRDFFNTDEAWPENDAWSAYQPRFEYLIARTLIDIYFDPALGEITGEGVDFLTEILPDIDHDYEVSLSTTPGKSVNFNAKRSLGTSEMKQIVEVAKAINFLMNMEPFDIAHYAEDDERSQDHSHEWPKATLTDDECEDSLSYIGYEEYGYCELAVLVAMKAINPQPEDVVKIISIAPRVLEVLDINQNQ